MNPVYGPWRDQAIAKALVRVRPETLELVAELWGDNTVVVNEAVRVHGAAIQHASLRLRADHHMALIAASNDPSGSFFQHLAPSLRADREIVLCSVKEQGSLIHAVDPHFLEDEEVILNASSTYPALSEAHETLRKNKDLALRVSQICPATDVGKNLQEHIHDIDFLDEVIKGTAKDGIFLCRVVAMSGKSVLTSFPRSSREEISWEKHCLGLQMLFSTPPMHAKVTAVCNGIVSTGADWSTWTRSLVDDTPFGLSLHKVNEISVVID